MKKKRLQNGVALLCNKSDTKGVYAVHIVITIAMEVLAKWDI